MAQRKKAHTAAEKPNYESDEGAVVNSLTKPAYDQLIRLARNGSIGRAQALVTICDDELERLGVNADPKKAETKTPDASDQVDVGSFHVWATGLQQDDTAGIDQLLAIQATANARL